MNGNVSSLEKLLENGGGSIGEIVIRGTFEITHHADSDRDNLQVFNSPIAARELAKYDAAGIFRPLKTAPNLRRGWKLVLRDLQEVRAAIEEFYPAMLGVFRTHERGVLLRVNLRETLNRQSGMYAVTKKLSDQQADSLIGRFCRSCDGCLKTILWRIDDNFPMTSLPEEKFDPAVDQAATGLQAIPLLCHEACNLLVAAARDVVRGTEGAPK